MVGLPKAIIKKYGVTKKAWAVFRGRRKSRHSSKKMAKTHRSTRRNLRSMARRRFHRRGGGKSLQRSLFKLIRGGALAAPLVARALEYKAAPARIPVWALRDYTGVDLDDGSFELTRMARGWAPFLAATAATYAVPKVASFIRKL